MTASRTDDWADLRDEVRRFVAGLGDTPPSDDLAHHFAHLVDVQRALHEAGLAVVSWPTRWGGRGLPPVAAAVVADEMGRTGAPEVINFVALEVVAPGLMAHASEEQLDAWLPPMASADRIWCQMFSEPDAGSDLAGLRTAATADCDGWRLSGSKVWCTWGQFADYGLCLARTGPRESRHRGITAFVVDMRSRGIEVRPLRSMTGSEEFAEVLLDDVVVAATDVVGEVGGGWAVAMSMLAAERGTYAVRRASVVRAAAAECSGDVDALVSMSRLDHRIKSLIATLERGGEMGADSVLTKVALTAAEQTVHAARLAALGADAMIDGPIVRDWLYSRAASIYGGTAQVQRNIIGERLLGLPREPARDGGGR